jgi:hypothetical protein
MGAGKKEDWDNIVMLGSVHNPPKTLGHTNHSYKSLGNFHTTRHHAKRF